MQVPYPGELCGTYYSHEAPKDQGPPGWHWSAWTRGASLLRHSMAGGRPAGLQVGAAAEAGPGDERKGHQRRHERPKGFYPDSRFIFSVSTVVNINRRASEG